MSPGTMMIVGLLILLGACSVLYPTAASWISDVVQRTAVSEYRSVLDGLPDARVARAIAAADAYNRSLTGGASADPFTDLATANRVDDDVYWSLLSEAPDDVMSIVRIPVIGLDLPLRHGTSDAVLRDGLGHLRGSALPVGGERTHTVITGHNGVPEATLFSRLDELAVGDDVHVSTYGRDLTYRVTGTEVVLPADVRGLHAEPGGDRLTLITCTPTGVNSHRLVVTAERVPVAAPSEQVPSASPVGFPWWILVLCGVLSVEAAVALWWLRAPRHGVARRSSATGS